MSADNGIVVCEFAKEMGPEYGSCFLVAHVFMSPWVEMIDPDSDYYSPTAIREMLEDSPTFYSKDEAFNYAVVLEGETGWTEYGIFFDSLTYKEYTLASLSHEAEFDYARDVLNVDYTT